jgi:hypothetical protein
MAPSPLEMAAMSAGLPMSSKASSIGSVTTGNGPNYVGRVIVVGYDEFGLDSDHDGIGCDNAPTGLLWPT